MTAYLGPEDHATCYSMFYVIRFADLWFGVLGEIPF